MNPFRHFSISSVLNVKNLLPSLAIVIVNEQSFILLTVD